MFVYVVSWTWYFPTYFQLDFLWNKLNNLTKTTKSWCNLMTLNCLVELLRLQINCRLWQPHHHRSDRERRGCVHLHHEHHSGPWFSQCWAHCCRYVSLCRSLISLTHKTNSQIIKVCCLPVSGLPRKMSLANNIQELRVYLRESEWI